MSSAMAGDLNTEEITNRVKETLLNNNIGQKLFGEAVLNLSQGLSVNSCPNRNHGIH